MTDYREVERYRKDPEACQTLARALRKAHAEDFTLYETEFIEDAAHNWANVTDISTRRAISGLTTRQVEKLLEIRDEYSFVTTINTFSVKILIAKVDMARLDLSNDDDVEWIHALAVKAEPSYRRKVAHRVLRLARELNLIDD